MRLSEAMGEMPGSEAYSQNWLRSRHALQIGRSPVHLLLVSVGVGETRQYLLRQHADTLAAHGASTTRNTHLRLSLTTRFTCDSNLFAYLSCQSHSGLEPHGSRPTSEEHTTGPLALVSSMGERYFGRALTALPLMVLAGPDCWSPLRLGPHFRVRTSSGTHKAVQC